MAHPMDSMVTSIQYAPPSHLCCRHALSACRLMRCLTGK